MPIERLQTTSHHCETRNNISSPSSSITQAKQEMALEPSPLKSQPIVSEKKNSHEEIDLTDETSDKTNSKVEFEWAQQGHALSNRSCVAIFRFGKYSDRVINDESLSPTFLDRS